jgi:hypothetical protein
MPFKEITLIRQGNVAAALTLGGALIGFSMTVASGLVHTDALGSFVGWSAADRGQQYCFRRAHGIDLDIGRCHQRRGTLLTRLPESFRPLFT